jgi:hypothetical protein
MTTDSTFEPSGIEWHSGRSQFVIVGDEGQVAMINAAGGDVHMWALGNTYDFEGVAIDPSILGYAYLLDENTSSAFEFDLEAGALTGKSWSFSDKISEVDGAGAEGLAYANGSFYVGWQYDGDIFVYSVDLETSGSQSFVQEIHTTSGYYDISGLTYNSDTNRLAAIYDSLNILEEWSLDGTTLLASYSLPGSNQEGVAFVNDCASSTATVVVAEDSGAVVSYAGYPMTCTTTEEPESTPEPAPTVSSVAGTTNGDITVSYSDGTSMTYDIFAVTTSMTTNVRTMTGTSYYLVYVGRYAALVDASNGDVYASTTFTRGNIHPIRWARTVLGL